MSYHISQLSALPPECKVKAISSSKFNRLFFHSTHDHGVISNFTTVSLPAYGVWAPPFFYCEFKYHSLWYPFRIYVPTQFHVLELVQESFQ